MAANSRELTEFGAPSDAVARGSSAWVADPVAGEVIALSLASPERFDVVARWAVDGAPASVALDPLMPALGRDPVVIAADRDAHVIRFLDASRPAAPTFAVAVPGLRAVASSWTR